MKIVRSQIYLMQVLLIVAAAILTLIGFLFSAQDLTAIWGTIDQGEAHYPVILNFTHLAYFAGLMFLYLSFEFYGLKSALYGVIAFCLMMVGTYLLFKGLNRLSSQYPIALLDQRLFGFYNFDRKNSLAGLVAYFCGFNILFLTAALIKRITHDYFMFIRFPIAGVLGFATYVALDTALKFYEPGAAPATLLPTMIGPAAEFAVLVPIAVVPLYLLRLFLSLFRGRYKEIAVTPNTAATPTTTETSVTELVEKESTAWRLFKALVVIPVILGLTIGLIGFGVIEAYHYNLILDVPYVVVKAHAHPIDSTLQLIAAVAILIIGFRLLLMLVSALLTRRKAKRELKNQNVVTSSTQQVAEDTESENSAPQNKTV